jgi:hypothetical protein
MLHRRRVIMLLLLAMVAVLGFILFSSVRPSSVFSIAAPTPKPVNQLPQGISSTLSGPLKNVSGTTLLEKPRYTGQDALGRSWTVQAETALQGGSATSGTYILQQVTAEWQNPQQQTPLLLSADQGDYNQADSSLQLTGNVQATGMGLTLAAPQMNADLTTRHITATGGSHVTGRVGKETSGWNIDLKAPTLAADPSRSTLLFTGGVRAKLTPIN